MFKKDNNKIFLNSSALVNMKKDDIKNAAYDFIHYY